MAGSNILESMKHWVAIGGATLAVAGSPPGTATFKAEAAAAGICIPVPMGFLIFLFSFFYCTR